MCRMVPQCSILRTGYTDLNLTLLWNELRSKAPTLLAILKAASGCDNASQNSLIPLEVAPTILLYSRSKHLCHVQTIVGGLLYSGHAAKYSQLKDCVPSHILHKYSAAMSEKSVTVRNFMCNVYVSMINYDIVLQLVQVPQGIILKSENVHEEMMEIVMIVQKYVPYQ